MPSRRVVIKAGEIKALAELNDTKTAQAIYEALPIRSRVNLWGDEIYFSIPIHLDLEGGKEEVNVGDLGYWPDGDAFCIFFGPTPISSCGKIKPASAVSVFGRVLTDTSILKQVGSGSEIIVEKTTRDKLTLR